MLVDLYHGGPKKVSWIFELTRISTNPGHLQHHGQWHQATKYPAQEKITHMASEILDFICVKSTSHRLPLKCHHVSERIISLTSFHVKCRLCSRAAVSQRILDQ